jgi:hypothetical protein
LKEDDILLRPGAAKGVPVHVLYGMYIEWTARLVPTQAPVTPFQFARSLRRLGFRKRHRDQTNGDDQRLLGSRTPARSGSATEHNLTG